MILELCALLRQNGELPLKELAQSLSLPPEIVRAMLERLIRAGKVKRSSCTLCRGGCRNCSPETIEIYRWIDHT
jgi:DNA-binding Lrp family transcriptional regulator